MDSWGDHLARMQNGDALSTLLDGEARLITIQAAFIFVILPLLGGHILESPALVHAEMLLVLVRLSCTHKASAYMQAGWEQVARWE